MKTNVKILIAAAATALAATFSTGASAASLFELHEQHKAELLNFVFGGHGVQGNINVGPAYQAPPVYVDPYGRQPGYRGGRGLERRDHRDGRDGRGGYGRDYGRHDGRGYNR